MWKYVGENKGYPGLPFEDLTDEQMEELKADFEPRFKDTHGTIEESKLWEHLPDEEASAVSGAPSPPAGEILLGDSEER